MSSFAIKTTATMALVLCLPVVSTVNQRTIPYVFGKKPALINLKRTTTDTTAHLPDSRILMYIVSNAVQEYANDETKKGEPKTPTSSSSVSNVLSL